MLEKIYLNIEESISIKRKVLESIEIKKSLSFFLESLVSCYSRGNKVYFVGNGGSFSDAQHLAAELSGRFYLDRDPLECILLGSNLSYLTAVSNDYSYEEIFSRELRSSGKRGDVMISLTTSGNSKNIINALGVARELGITTISFSGKGGGIISKLSDSCITIPSEDTARIQECHMLIGHSILELLENKLYKK